MKLKDYVKKLQELAEKLPDLEVVYAVDEEGNAFHPVLWEPSLGHYIDEDSGFVPIDDIEDPEEEIVNAVCVN